MSIRSSGIRDIAYVLSISPVTVINTIREYAKSIKEEQNTYPMIMLNLMSNGHLWLTKRSKSGYGLLLTEKAKR